MSKWSDADAAAAIAKYPDVNEDIALRVYTSQLIGSDSTLVLHGGGNTSVKTTATTILGDEIEVLAVKGSGWNLDTIEPPGFPLVDLGHCRRLRDLPSLSDEDMVNQLRTHMLDCKSPNPSVETLLHAFLPHKFVDHSHADAIVALADQPDAEALIASVLGDGYAVVPYIMPGFALAKLAAEVYEANPNAVGLVLLKHGLFTFGDTAKESYERHVAAVTAAREFLGSDPNAPYAGAASTLASHAITGWCSCTGLLHNLRGYMRAESGVEWIVSFRESAAAVAFAGHERVKELSQRGPLTPDHVIRTKAFPVLFVGRAPNEWDKESVAGVMDSYVAAYKEYFERQSERVGGGKTALDPFPRVALVEGLGLVTIGRTVKETTISADIYEHTIDTVLAAERVGSYAPVAEDDQFDMEYWSLEQAKLGKKATAPFVGRVVFITGAASGIGLATAYAFGREGAAVFVVDLNDNKLNDAVAGLNAEGIAAASSAVDVTYPETVEAAVSKCTMTFGGVDILVSNAGLPFQAPNGLAMCTGNELELSMAVNFYGHQYCAAATTRVFLNQGYGGTLLFNASKAAMNPGKGFGPYCIAKAATVALAKQYAVDYGNQGVRSNVVNADRVRTALFTDELIKERAEMRGITPDEYFKSNLLKVEVTADDVAAAFIALADSRASTAAVLTVDGGNIAASVR